MKIRRSIYFFIFIIALLIILVMWYGKKKPIEALQADSQTTDLQATIATNTLAGGPIRSNASVKLVTNVSVTPQPVQTDQTMREELAELNDVDIVFYGRLEDQFGNAVGGAQVNFEIPYNNGQTVGVNRGKVMADATGLFTITGHRGKSLDVVPIKSGYVLASRNGGGIYSLLWPDSRRAHPDSSNPVVIKMWKLQGAEPLVDINKQFKLPFTNEPIFFDLVTGNVVPAGGDLEAIITRAPGSLSKKSPGDWSIDLKPVNGGIIRSDYQTAQFTLEAPEEGYQDDYLVQMNGNDPAWHDGIDQEFFLKSRDGQVYSKFYLVFGINREPNDPLSFQFKGAANPNNSRNWEATASQ